MKKKYINNVKHQLIDEYKWIDREFINEKRVSLLDIFDFDENNICYKFKDCSTDYKIISINYNEVKNNQIKNIIDFLLDKKSDKKILIVINYLDLKNIYNELNEIFSLEKIVKFKIEHKYFNKSLILIISKNNINNIETIINLREDKINLANKLINSYQKEEYFLNSINNNLNKEEPIQKNYLKEIVTIRKEKMELSKILLQSYQKEEYLLNSYNKLLKQYENINKKYSALSKSKLGKLTIWYWKEKKKRG